MERAVGDIGEELGGGGVRSVASAEEGLFEKPSLYGEERSDELKGASEASADKGLLE